MHRCDTPGLGHFAYYRSGLVIAETLRQIATSHLGPTGGKILDFACGYGRSLRYTIDDFGAGNVWACELLPDAVTFVGDVLGAHALRSAVEPRDLQIAERFDVVFVASLFTHLPIGSFHAWLTALHRLLTPMGILVISVHDEVLLPPGAALDEAGFWFQPLSEIDEIDGADYGATVVTAQFMKAAISAATGNDRYLRFPTALCFDQDLYVIPASASSPLALDQPRRGSQGLVDHASLQDGTRFVADGWATTQDDERVTAVEIRLDDELVALVPPVLVRPDVDAAVHRPATTTPTPSGWSCDVMLDHPHRANAVCTVVARTSGGCRDILWSLPLSKRPSADSAPPVPFREQACAVAHSNAELGRRAIRALARRARRTPIGALPQKNA